MMKKIYALFLIVAFGLTVFSTEAETPVPDAPTAEKARSDEEYQAAFRFLEAAQMDWQLDETWKLMVEAQLASLPPETGEKLAPVMLDFFRKYCSFEVLKDDLARLYLKHFSKEELDQLTVFYSSDIGRKLVERNPQLSSDAMKLTQQKTAEHAAELQAALAKAMQ